MLLLFGTCMMVWAELPAEVPRHFNASGEPDAYASKGFIFFLPAIGLFLTTLMGLAMHFPSLINIPIKREERNREEYILESQKLVAWLQVLLAAGFAYCHWQTILVAMGESSGLGLWYLPIFLGAIFCVLSFFLVRIWKTTKQ
nr:DUF1648 domain-containing protein [Thalassobacillus sp. CUG 92003]